MENSYRKELAKIASIDINLANKNDKAYLTITMDFIMKNKKPEHITINFANSSLRLFSFVNILFHVVEVKKWSQLVGKKAFVLYDKDSIYRICNEKDNKLFLDFVDFFHVDC